jgi:hypothetical protein
MYDFAITELTDKNMLSDSSSETLAEVDKLTVFLKNVGTTLFGIL